MNFERVLCDGRCVKIEKDHERIYEVVRKVHKEIKIKSIEWENYKNPRYQRLLVLRKFIFKLICVIESPAADKLVKTTGIFTVIRDYISEKEEMIETLRHVRKGGSEQIVGQKRRADKSAARFEEIFSLVKEMLVAELGEIPINLSTE